MALAVAGAMLERDARWPPRRLRGRSRPRLPVGGALARDGERAVARQPRAPVLEPRLHHLLDQQPAKPRAIDEQIARDFAPVGKRDVLDQAALAVSRRIDDAALDARPPAGLGKPAQQDRKSGV